MSASQITPLPPVLSAAFSSVAAAAKLAQIPNPANLADRGESISLAAFDDQAGINPHKKRYHNAVSLQQRLAQPRPNRVPLRRTRNTMHLDAEDSDEHLHAASSDVLEALHGGERSDLEDRLVDSYDALERHALLRYARSKVDESDFSQTEKDRLKNDLNGMLADLMDSHGDAIRAGLKNKDAFESALGQMDALSAGSNAENHTGSLSELRALYGSRGNGKTEMGLTPMGLAKSLMDRFGADNFLGALGGLRSKMAGEFRTRPADRAGPRLWLSLADAASFNVVQSSFALAGDLRRDLSECAKVVGKASQAETALALLGATEQGRGRADPLLGHIADSKTLTALQQLHLYRLTRQAVEKMPMTAWPKDVPAQRLNLLDELRTLISDVCDKLPRAATAAAQFEQEMRDIVRRKRDRDDADRGRDEQESDDELATLDEREGR